MLPALWLNWHGEGYAYDQTHQLTRTDGGHGWGGMGRFSSIMFTIPRILSLLVHPLYSVPPMSFLAVLSW